MCILFVNLAKSVKNGEFKLILASNRDEFFKRPAKSAHFWEECSTAVGGRDMTENREGGTWLAMSKTGNIGVLLNVTGEESDPDKRGRGPLVADFVKGKLTNKSYVTELAKHGDEFNKFHLVALSLGSSDEQAIHYTNSKQKPEERVTIIPEECFAVGNSAFEQPFMKVVKGKEKFEEIVQKYGQVNKKVELMDKLLELLRDEQKYYPDPVLMDKKMDLPLQYQELYSSVCVKMPGLGYGTRTHTIILVDNEGNADFMEWTMQSPDKPDIVDWMCSHHAFSITN